WKNVGLAASRRSPNLRPDLARHRPLRRRATAEPASRKRARLLLALAPCVGDILRQRVDVADETGNLPDLVFGHQLAPGSHTSVSDAVLTDPVDLPLRSLRRFGRELGNPREERSGPPQAWVRTISVTARTVVTKQSHSCHQVNGRWWKRISKAESFSLHRSVEQ